LDEHSKESSDPRPKERSWTADFNGCANAYDISNPNAAADGCEKSFKRVDPVSARLIGKEFSERAQNRREFSYLEKTGLETEIKAQYAEKKKSDVCPNKIVEQF
jgi:hypothetical protein